LYGDAAVQGIVLELPGGLRAEEFSLRVNHMVSALGAAVALPSRHSLVLFSGTIDQELLAHRLSKSLKTKALSVFTADNAQAVPDIIRPYL
jgi:thymidine phosphorylase